MPQEQSKRRRVPDYIRSDNGSQFTAKTVRQRLDGFISLDAGPEGGELVTPLLVFEGNRLNLNIDCGALGEAGVELQDESDSPIPGFTEHDSVSVDRNGVAQQVWWHNEPDVRAFAGQPVRLRIKMRSAKLYAFQFVSD